MPLRRIGIGATALALAVAGSATLLGPGLGSASSHREAPLNAGDPKVDNTDVYAFVSPDTVTLSANWIPFEEPNGGPNFYPFGSRSAAAAGGAAARRPRPPRPRAGCRPLRNIGPKSYGKAAPARFLQSGEAAEPVVNAGEGGVLSGAEATLQPSLCD